MLTAYLTASLDAHPPNLYPDYRSTVKRAPARPLVVIPHTLSELTGPVYGHESLGEHDADLTRPAHGRAGRRAHHRHGARRRRGRPACARHPRGDLAGERGRA